MLLVIDVSNTQTVLGLFDGTDLVQHWRVSTDDRRTADELAVLVGGLLGGSRTHPDGVDASAVTGVACCSTVPAVLHELREMLGRFYDDVPCVVVEPGTRTGVPVHMDNPREVGADRIVNVLAASRLVRTGCVVVDFGTATSFDVVSPEGAYIGSVTAPGVEISLEALGVRGALLRRFEVVRPRSIIATNTVEALQSGAVYGFAAMVDGIVERIRDEQSRVDEVSVIATGSFASLVVDECRSVDRYEPWLTLNGLRMVFDHNVSAGGS